jgi:hypothetical protein
MSLADRLLAISVFQVSVPLTIRSVANELADDPDHNKELTERLASILRRLGDDIDPISEFLKQFHGDMAFEKVELYLELIRSLEMRKKVVEHFNNPTLIVDKSSAGTLLRIADAYDALVKHLRQHVKELGAYISERERRAELAEK